MYAPSVVEDLDVFKYGCLGLGPRLKPPAVQPLLLELASERFHRGVVIAVAFTAHAAYEFILIQYSLVFFTGILDTAIRMNEQPFLCASPTNGLVQGFYDKGLSHVLGHGKANDCPAAQIHNAGEVQPSFIGCDIGDIAHPFLVRLVCYKFAV